MFLYSYPNDTLFALVSCGADSQQLCEVVGFEESCRLAETMALELGTDVVVYESLEYGELGDSLACFLG